MKHKWGTPDMLLGRAYRFCEVCGAAQHAERAVALFDVGPSMGRDSHGVADYIRSDLRWVYEGSATDECPGKHTEYEWR